MANKRKFFFVLFVFFAVGVILPVSANENGDETRTFPDWFLQQQPPDWFFEVDVLPGWFFDLPAEPVWFRQIDRIPGWFFTITEIPDWFFPVEPTPEPQPPPETNIEPQPPVVPEPGELIPENGTPSNVPENGEPPEQGVVLFEVELDGGEFVVANIPNGMITSGEVILFFPPELILNRNRGFVDYTQGEPLTENGLYELFLTDLETVVFGFTIAATPVNDIEIFTAPQGFMLVGATFNGEPQYIADPLAFALDEDGVYGFTVTNETYSVVLEVNITLDTVLPQVIFSRVVDGEVVERLEFAEEGGNTFRGPVVFEIEGGGEYTVTALFNRTSFNPRANTLTQAGNYTITITDAAGNEVQFSFRILYVMDIPTVWVIVIVVAMIGGLTAYLIRNRVKARVR